MIQLEQLKALKDIFLAILGDGYDESVNSLGIFEYIENSTIIGTAPAIRIGFPLENDKPIYRMKKDSGIQCIIDSKVEVSSTRQNRFNLVNTYLYTVYLDQYDPYGNLTDSLDAINKMPLIVLARQPIIRPVEIQPDNGFIPSRAILMIKYFNVSHSYF